jgi:Cu/Zn superoxide dismutase
MRNLFVLLLFGVITTTGTAWGASVYVTMSKVDSGGVGNSIGIIEFQDTAKGLKVWPRLRGLTQGQHGIHVRADTSTQTRSAGTRGQQDRGIWATCLCSMSTRPEGQPETVGRLV